jgi:hypothetical protein
VSETYNRSGQILVACVKAFDNRHDRCGTLAQPDIHHVDGHRNDESSAIRTLCKAVPHQGLNIVENMVPELMM